MEHSFSVFVRAVIDGDVGAASRLLTANPEFAAQRFDIGATRGAAACCRLAQTPTRGMRTELLHFTGRVRTRSAMAARALLAGGANVHLKNKNGSTPFDLAVRNTGRGGTGSTRAREQQTEIIAMLLEAGARPVAAAKRRR
jgi:ankyrin repeat protein